MSGFSFNLLDEGWIPCVRRDGWRTEHLGIRDTLLRAHEFREICDPSPLVTVALHRLLLAALYRALEPLETDRQWKQLWRAGSLPADRIEVYLEKWRERFDLFGEEHPFYQTPRLQAKSASSVARLANELASGHNLTLFDHSFDDAGAAHTPAEAARFLVAHQAFAVALGSGGEPTLAGDAIQPPHTADGPLIRGLTISLAGDTLAETLLLNLVPAKITAEDAPVWELSPDKREASMDRREPGAKDNRHRTPPRGLLDLFTWQSRRILLEPEPSDSATVVRSAHVTQGRSLDKDDPIPRDPMQAYRRTDKSEGFQPVRVVPEKATWRDLHALLASEGNTKSPEALSLAARMVADGVLDRRRLYGVNAVGLASAGGKAAKTLLWRHDRISLPAALLEDRDLMSYVRSAITDAEKMADDLSELVRHVCRLFLAPNSDRPDGRKANADDLKRLASALNPQRSYWARLEEPFHRFLQDLPGGADAAIERWYEAVEGEARRSFQEACTALGTSALAIRAVAGVSDYFRIPGRLGVLATTQPAQP